MMFKASIFGFFLEKCGKKQIKNILYFNTKYSRGTVVQFSPEQGVVGSGVVVVAIIERKRIKLLCLKTSTLLHCNWAFKLSKRVCFTSSLSLTHAPHTLARPLVLGTVHWSGRSLRPLGPWPSYGQRLYQGDM